MFKIGALDVGEGFQCFGSNWGYGMPERTVPVKNGCHLYMKLYWALQGRSQGTGSPFYFKLVKGV
jgi:hypothetical protein